MTAALGETTERLLRLAEGATPGPWRSDGTGLNAMVRGSDATIVATRHRLPARINEPNMALIAAVPDMIQHIRALSERLARVEADAVRYQWIRSEERTAADAHEWEGLSGEALDAAIDEVMRAGKSDA